jgi:hypothetical protein
VDCSFRPERSPDRGGRESVISALVVPFSVPVPVSVSVSGRVRRLRVTEYL